MSQETAAPGVADPITLASLGVLAYVTETLLHEAAGHGGVCLATGGQITLLAPLYMRCSVSTPLMVAAGPAMNAVAGFACLLALRLRSGQAGPLRYFLWLSLVFNWLVAAGYLLVGGLTGFGDWAALFASVRLDWAWRAPAVLVAVLLYGSVLRFASREFARLTGLGRPSKAILARLVVVPSAAAALVATAAELYGQGGAPLGLALALGCTLFVGLTLMGMGANSGVDRIADSALRIPFRGIWVALAVVAGITFIFFVGPGAHLSSR